MKEGARLKILRTVSEEAYEQRPSAVSSEPAQSDQDAYQRLLYQAGIALSASTYCALCITSGFFLFIEVLTIGPILSCSLAIALVHELLVTVPLERAARRRYAAIAHLPVCLESIGMLLIQGISIEMALTRSIRNFPNGYTVFGMEGVLQRMQQGVPADAALIELLNSIDGPEVRASVAALRMSDSNGERAGQSLIGLATMLRSDRIIMDRVRRQMVMIHWLYVAVFVVLLAACFAAYKLMDPDILFNVQPIPAFIREIGGVLMLGATIGVTRLTSIRAMETGYDS